MSFSPGTTSGLRLSKPWNVAPGGRGTPEVRVELSWLLDEGVVTKLVFVVERAMLVEDDVGTENARWFSSGLGDVVRLLIGAVDIDDSEPPQGAHAILCDRGNC